ncbi:penicillin-binding protein [Ktedonosporobacter rubrisoli]|uniref:Penicillin-binding protein n=1 Tax=Ktedonosporobacter rubrisoli TaxID=2509675 RepID=A0A4P6JYC7_KTERU|nr:transglycosylase domain-containing protein [Ktedonosporobacter rubrisoli]QBD80727.1 penicillin-binding protein [Ktedonosporobacter rubrisoli]
MRTEQQSTPSSSVEESASATQGTTGATLDKTSSTTAEETSKQARVAVLPAKLPENSRAARAQRLNDMPEEPTRGVYYKVPHKLSQPTGWRTKRHLKRRNLHLSNLRYLATERLGTRGAMLPLASAILAIAVISATILVAISVLADATNQRYGQQVLTLQDILPKDNLKIYDSRGSMIYQATDAGLQTTVPLSKISPHLVNAEVAIEDQYFWKNPGFDITGLVRAALEDVTHGHILSGGSTLTQQLIKQNIVGDQVSMTRKLQELIIAPDITRRFTKEQIMEMYLNTTFYGEQAYGAEAAAFTYFGLQDTPTKTAAQQLDIAQAAMLAGIPSSPFGRDPYLHPKAAFARVQEVLRQMYLQGYITNQERLQAINEVQQPNFLKHGVIKNDSAPHFVNYTLNELARDLHVKVSDLSRSGLIVNTTLDLNLQNRVLKDAQKHIAEIAQAHHVTNAAEVVIDFHTGAILTMLGNIDPNNPRDGAFDVASQGLRQPGSAFKPFIYATAFEHGVSPGAPVLDGPLTIQMCCGLPAYTPHNYDMSYHGLITYRYALQNSFNIPAVKLMMQTGVDASLKMAQDLGISAYNGTPNYTMVLGSLGVHLLDMTSAYGTFANGGVHIPPHTISTVKDVHGKTIFQFNDPGKRVLSKQAAFMVTNVLSDNTSRSFEFTKCSALYLYSTSQSQCYAGNTGPVRPAAAKTGTSNDFRDNLTMGYTTDYVVGVWAGNNDNSPMVDVTGVDGAGPIWHDTMMMVEQGKPIRNFANPSGVVKKTVSYPGITTTDWYIQK